MPDAGRGVAGDVNGRITGTEHEMAGRLFGRLPVLQERDWYLMLHGELDFSFDDDAFGNDHYAATLGAIYRRAMTQQTAAGINVFVDLGEYGEQSMSQLSLGFETETVWPDEAEGESDSWHLGGNLYLPFEDYTETLPARAPQLGGDLYTGLGTDWDFQRLETTLTGFYYTDTDTAEAYYGGALDVAYRYYDLEDVLPVGSHLFAGVGLTYDNFHDDAELRGEVGLTITFDDGRDDGGDVPRYERVAEVRRNLATGSPFIPVEPTPMWASSAAPGAVGTDFGCGPGDAPFGMDFQLDINAAYFAGGVGYPQSAGTPLGAIVTPEALDNACSLGGDGLSPFADCVAGLAGFPLAEEVIGDSTSFVTYTNLKPGPGQNDCGVEIEQTTTIG
ncbi:MAG: hypothetical protein RLO50_15435 [Azospirillaceae bacterium]